MTGTLSPRAGTGDDFGDVGAERSAEGDVRRRNGDGGSQAPSGDVSSREVRTLSEFTGDPGCRGSAVDVAQGFSGTN